VRPGFTMDVEFEIEPDGLFMRVRQHNEMEQVFLEAEAWRLYGDGRQVNSAFPAPGPSR